MKKLFLFSIIIFLFSTNPIFAGCSADAYNKMCIICTFDENGKVDNDCWQGIKNSGIACVTSKHPIMSAAYSAGECPKVDECAAQLSACQSRHTTGNDKLDCEQGHVYACYVQSDKCVAEAAKGCGEEINFCAPTAIGIFAGFVVVARFFA